MPIEYLMWAPLAVLSLILYLTLAAAALFSLAGSSWVSSSARRAWMLAVILLPVAGSILWLAASHRRTVAFPSDDGDHPRAPDAPDTSDAPDAADAADAADVPVAPDESDSPDVLLDVHDR